MVTLGDDLRCLGCSTILSSKDLASGDSLEKCCVIHRGKNVHLAVGLERAISHQITD